jgi:hypothetical protein
MSANFLLLWMSARHHGTWAQFRAAVEELHVKSGDDVEGEGDDASDPLALPFYQTLRLNLQRVGHAEFFAGAGDGAEWRVTPPALAVTRRAGGWLGVVAGARSLPLLDRLREAAEGTVKLQTITFPAYPDQLLLAADENGALTHVASKAGLILQNDASAAILANLPPVDDPSVRHPVQLPFGSEWRIERFSSEDLVWRATTRDEAAGASAGLFRFSLRHQRHTLFCTRGAAFRIPGQVGKFLVLRRRRRNVLRHDPQSWSLSVPASCRPPFLIERTLVLCSGSPPTYEGGARSGVLHYAEVPDSIARLAAALLRQDLR